METENKEQVMEEIKTDFMETTATDFIASMKTISIAIHEISIEKGWWDKDRNDGEMIALMHSELSELLEALRHGNPASDHIPEFSAVEEELADVIIRVMDYSEARGYRIGEAIITKMIFNSSREHKHGGKKF